MRIDERIEERVRDAFGAAIAKDGDRMADALRPLDEADARTAVAYAVFAAGVVLTEVYQGEPSHDDLVRMAQRMIDSESDWVRLGDADNVAGFLAGAARGDTTFPGVGKDEIIGYAFVGGAYLLTSYRRDHPTWYEHLDAIWNAAEAVPGQS